MENDLYREVLLERLANPINKGEIVAPDLSARLVNPLCGDEVLLQMRVKDRKIDQAVYTGNGCAISQVSASFLAEKIEGKNFSEIASLSENDILEMLGINPGPSRLKCAILSLQVLKQALKNG